MKISLRLSNITSRSDSKKQAVEKDLSHTQEFSTSFSIEPDVCLLNDFKNNSSKCMDGDYHVNAHDSIPGGCLKVRSQRESISSSSSASSTASTDCASDTSSCASTSHAKVQFTTLECRSYNICLGDNPAVTNGPPLSLSWDVVSTISLPVDEYEMACPERRCKSELAVPKTMREDWLREVGYSRSDFNDTEKEMKYIQKSRKVNASGSIFGKASLAVMNMKR